MIVTIVRFPSEPGLTVDSARERFGSNAASYLEVPGLIWKAYVLNDNGSEVGGVYWWADRASAEAKYNEGWRAGMIEKYGAPPEIEWFEAPVVVDTVSQVVRVDPPPAPSTKSGNS